MTVRKFRVIAVDDEQLALRRLEIVLSKISEVDLVATANSASAAIELIQRLSPDVALLDIAMPGQTGFDLIDTLPAESLPRIIFVTAFDQYAIEAFDRNAVDYILKPVQVDRVRKSLERAARVADLEDQAEQLKRLVANLALNRDSPEYEHEFWAQRYGERVRVPVVDVVWAQAERDYVRLHTSRGSFLVRGTMDGLERRLDPREFARVHRCAVVRISQVLSVRRRPTGVLVAKLASGEEINIGRRFAKDFSAARTGLASAPQQ